MTAAVVHCRADSVSLTETYNERLLNDPDFGGYYVDYTDANVVQASVSFQGQVDTSTFDQNTEFTVNVADGLVVADNFLGDDPRYRAGKKSAAFSYVDPDSTLAYSVALSWTATTMTFKASFANYDALDLYDLLNDGSPPYVAPAMDVQISFGDYSYDGVTTNIPVRDTKTAARGAVGEVFQLNHATAAVFAHDPNNPFYNAQGTYKGLFIGDTNSAAAGDSGMVKLVLTDSGAYSGKLWVAGGSWPVTGQFVVQGDGSISSGAVVNRGRAGELGLSLSLNTQSFPLSISGNVSNGLAWDSGLAANQTIYDPSAAPPGVWNVAMAPADTNSADGPGGYSYGKISVTAKGALTFTMNLADGSAAPVIFSGAVAQDGSFPYYFPLYKGQGVLIGWGNFAGDSTSLWAKEPVAGKFYPDGFAAQFPGNFQLALSPITRPSTGQATLTVGGAGIVEAWAYFDYDSVKNKFTLQGSGSSPVVSPPNPNPDNLTVALNPTTGVFSGSFSPGGGKIVFQGVFLSHSGSGYGFFAKNGQTGWVVLTSPQWLPPLPPPGHRE